LGKSETSVLKIKSSDLLDWDDSHGHRFTHDFFKFPGKFHPPIVENLLKRFAPRGVADPMAGVGTVAVEAKAAGIPSLSIDVDPLSLFFAQVKTTAIATSTLRSAWNSLKPAIDKFRRSEWQTLRYRFVDIAPSTMRTYLNEVDASFLSAFDYWFRRYVLVDYARIDHCIVNGGLPKSSSAVRRFFKACLLSAVRRISNADPAPVSGVEITRHMRERFKQGYEVDVVAEFERRVRKNMERMETYVEYLRNQETRNTPVAFILDDCKNINRIKRGFEYPLDLILFSPPYCNAIEYWRRHRLEYFLGGFLAPKDTGSHHRKFIGRRVLGGPSSDLPPLLDQNLADSAIRSLYYGNRRVKAWQLWHYFNDMKVRIGNFYKALEPAGKTVIIVGDSRTSDLKIPTSTILQNFALNAGFELETIARYSIKNRSMQYPLKNGDNKIAEESLIVVRKGRNS